MAAEHELNDEEWRTLFPDAPPRTRLNHLPSADQNPADPRPADPRPADQKPADPKLSDRELTGGLASRRLPADLLAAFDTLGTRFAEAWRRTGDVRVTIERAEAEWLRWGEFLWTLGADESVAVIDPLACPPASAPIPSPYLPSAHLSSSHLPSSHSGSKSPPRPSLPWHLTLHTRLLRSFWDRSLGGGDLPTAAASPVAMAEFDANRPLTAIERRLARKALRPLVALWLGSVGVAPPADGSRDGGSAAASTDGTEEGLGEFELIDATQRGLDSVEEGWVAMICFSVASGATSGRMRCVMPAEWTSAWLASRFATSPVSPTSSVSPTSRISPTWPGNRSSGSTQPATVPRDAVSERWTVELAEQSLPADALEDLRVGDVLRSDHPLDYPLLARAESGAGVVPVRIGLVDGEPVARRVDG